MSTYSSKIYGYSIGIDPSQSELQKSSIRSTKKPERGGLKNTMYVLADIENLPDELRGVANQIFINFPWSSLLRGIVLGEHKTWENIRKLCQRGKPDDFYPFLSTFSKHHYLSFPWK